jgi:prophage regulatory protein
MKLIKINQVMNMTSLARSTIYKEIASGLFPKPVSLSSRSVAWVESEVEDWIMQKVEARDLGSESSRAC